MRHACGKNAGIQSTWHPGGKKHGLQIQSETRSTILKSESKCPIKTSKKRKKKLHPRHTWMRAYLIFRLVRGIGKIAGPLKTI